ncbi:MAG: hypothetical protein EOO96_11800 [Pedobacter sp.]|nr:MAG: hypothetical protein EOO96_11800 [Pedobacter sp.]
MKKTIITSGVIMMAVGALSLQSCNSEKKADTTDTVVTTTTIDTTIVDSTSSMSKKMADTTDTGGRAGQAPPAVKN